MDITESQQLAVQTTGCDYRMNGWMGGLDGMEWDGVVCSHTRHPAHADLTVQIGANRRTPISLSF